MRGLLVAVVGIIVLTIGLVLGLRHILEAQPSRRETAIVGTTNSCESRRSDDAKQAPPGPDCDEKR